MIDQTSILVIYTGGTIGMIMDNESGALVPFNFDAIYEHIPALGQFHFQLDFHCFDPLLDSSNMNPEVWATLAEIIYNNYESYDGFVVLHGSDTMAYTASALSFMLENLNKPVIFTGSQLPLGVLRTDGRENFITAIEIAAAKEDETPLVPEVCIYFENQLLRANRTIKYNASFFHAFVSGNYPPLADVGVYIKYNKQNILNPNFKKLKVHKELDQNVGVLKLFPGILPGFIKVVLASKGMKALVIETFGSGNAPDNKDFLSMLKSAIDSGLIVINVSQCVTGTVEQGKYETSIALKNMGIISGNDITTESAITKLMYLLARYNNADKIKQLLGKSIRGEMTV